MDTIRERVQWTSEHVSCTCRKLHTKNGKWEESLQQFYMLKEESDSLSSNHIFTLSEL